MVCHFQMFRDADIGIQFLERLVRDQMAEMGMKRYKEDRMPQLIKKRFNASQVKRLTSSQLEFSFLPTLLVCNAMNFPFTFAAEAKRKSAAGAPTTTSAIWDKTRPQSSAPATATGRPTISDAAAPPTGERKDAKRADGGASDDRSYIKPRS